MSDTSTATDVALLVLCVLIAICLRWSYTLSARSGELDAIAATAKKLGTELLDIHKEAAIILATLQASNTASKDAVILELLGESAFLAKHIPDPRNKEAIRAATADDECLYHLSAVSGAEMVGNTRLTMVIDHKSNSVRLYNVPEEAPMEFQGVSTYTLKEWLETVNSDTTLNHVET